jgi:hypothetical protein
MANNPLSVPVASIVSYGSKKIMSLRQVAYKYGVVVQKTTTEEREILRSVKLLKISRMAEYSVYLPKKTHTRAQIKQIKGCITSLLT